MKELRALNKTPYCTGSKSFARVTHEDVCVSLAIYIYICRYKNFYYISNRMFMFYFFNVDHICGHSSYTSAELLKDTQEEGW
jgi:hypothetical protein